MDTLWVFLSRNIKFNVSEKVRVCVGDMHMGVVREVVCVGDVHMGVRKEVSREGKVCVYW
jgi:hypothetical protein